jgi:hypothetical protein
MLFPGRASKHADPCDLAYGHALHIPGSHAFQAGGRWPNLATFGKVLAPGFGLVGGMAGWLKKLKNSGEDIERFRIQP